MKRLAIIPARGGSKRIPRKNIKDFLGKPIIAYSIEAALNSGVFDEVMVSTDDEEIATVARQFGAEVPFMRSSKNADDFATTADVIIEVVQEYKNIGRAFDALCCIYPTAPFVTAERLKEGGVLLEKQDYIEAYIDMENKAATTSAETKHHVERFVWGHWYGGLQCKIVTSGDDNLTMLCVVSDDPDLQKGYNCHHHWVSLRF